MRSEAGFTLIEVMIVMVIVVILAAIAVPGYQGYAVRANRSAAQQFMVDLGSRAEQYRLDARQYPGDIGTGAGQINVTVPADVSDYYTVDIDAFNANTPPTYTITATPRAGTMQADESTLTLLSSGQKTPASEW